MLFHLIYKMINISISSLESIYFHSSIEVVLKHLYWEMKWVLLLCAIIWDFCLKDLEHRSHLKGLSPVCMTIWVCTLYLLENVFWHTGQLNGGFNVTWDAKCVRSSPADTITALHTGQPCWFK